MHKWVILLTSPGHAAGRARRSARPIIEVCGGTSGAPIAEPGEGDPQGAAETLRRPRCSNRRHCAHLRQRRHVHRPPRRGTGGGNLRYMYAESGGGRAVDRQSRGLAGLALDLAAIGTGGRRWPKASPAGGGRGPCGTSRRRRGAAGRDRHREEVFWGRSAEAVGVGRASQPLPPPGAWSGPCSRRSRVRRSAAPGRALGAVVSSVPEVGVLQVGRPSSAQRGRGGLAPGGRAGHSGTVQRGSRVRGTLAGAGDDAVACSISTGTDSGSSRSRPTVESQARRRAVLDAMGPASVSTTPLSPAGRSRGW